jgi:hypothetical protein
MIVGVRLARLFGVMNGMDMMALRDMRMVAGLLMVPGGMMLGSRAVVLGGVLMMLGGFGVMIRSVFRHGNTSGCMIRIGYHN